MSGGLEAIAMVALQELKEKQNSDSSTGADQKTPASTSTTVVASRSDVVSDGTDNAQLLSQGDNHVQVQVQQQGQQDLSTDDARGPSAVVTPTASSPSTTAAVLIDAGSQEQQEEKKPDPDHYHHHQEGTDAHTARVVSFENMVGCCSTSQPSAPSRASSNSSQVTPPAVPNSEDDCPGASSSATMISSDNVSQDPSSTTATTTGGVPVNHHKEGGLADFSHILADPEGWLRTNEPHFAVALASGNVDTKEVIVNIQPNDVLCGRGGETNHWTGNIQYRSLVKAYQKLYVDSTRRVKPKIAQCIVYSVRQSGGRFLKRLENPDKAGIVNKEGLPSSGGCWVDVGNVKAREKTSQALREGAPDLRSVSGGGSIDSRSTSADTTPASATSGHESPKALTAQPKTSAAVPSAAAGHGMYFRHGSSTPSATTPPPQHSTGPTPSMHHPFFHHLTPFQQQQIIMSELQATREAAAFARWYEEHPPSFNAKEKPSLNYEGPYAYSQDRQQGMKRHVPIMRSSLMEPRGPRLKRLKLRRQLEVGSPSYHHASADY